MKLSKRISCFLALVVILFALNVIQAVNTEAVGKDLSLAEMGRVIGGAKCEACLNYCATDDSCPSSRCDGEGDDGELCGSEGGTGASWTCGAWGDANDNCTLSTADANCVGEACHCNSVGSCWGDNADKNHPGKSNCSD